MKNRFVRWVVFLLIGVGIGALWGYYDAQNEMNDGVIALSPDDQAQAGTVIKKPSRTKSNDKQALKSNIGGDFELVDHNGNTVTNADFADTNKMIFFGFTYCPAICPTELTKMSLILEELGEDVAKTITPVFITIDPERDTTEQLKQYVEQFHPRLVGLGGSQEQIDAVKDSFKVFASKVENEMMEEYMMDHSSFMYLTDHDNKLIALYPATDTAAQIAEDISKRELKTH